MRGWPNNKHRWLNEYGFIPMDVLSTSRSCQVDRRFSPFVVISRHFE
jgi:hypothetical protein